MAASLITTTRSRDLRPLATAGQSMLDSWSTLNALLASELSPEHAVLLAEPVANPARGETDWYSAAEGPAVPMRSLPPPERLAAQATLDNQVAAIEALAVRLRASSTESDRLLGELLALTLHLPGDESIYVQNGRPLLVGWGHTRAGAEAASVVLSGTRPVPLGPMHILPPPTRLLLAPPRPSPRWPLGFLFAGLLASLLALLLLARDPFGWFNVVAPACVASREDLALLGSLSEQSARGAVLRGMLADVTAAAGRHRLMCAPVPSPAPHPAATMPATTPPGANAATEPPGIGPADAERARERGAHGGGLQIILAWDDENDLDLHVICPDGTEIYFSKKHGCGGELDVDANSPARVSTTPVEDVSFASPGPGRYRVIVDPADSPTYHGLRASDSSPFRVTIRRDGVPDQVVTGIARRGERLREVTSVEVSAP